MASHMSGWFDGSFETNRWRAGRKAQPATTTLHKPEFVLWPMNCLHCFWFDCASGRGSSLSCVSGLGRALKYAVHMLTLHYYMLRFLHHHEPSRCHSTQHRFPVPRVSSVSSSTDLSNLSNNVPSPPQNQYLYARLRGDRSPLNPAP